MGVLGQNAGEASTDPDAVKQQAGVIASVVAVPEEVDATSMDSGEAMTANMLSSAATQGLAEGAADQLVGGLGSMIDANAIVTTALRRRRLQAEAGVDALRPDALRPPPDDPPPADPPPPVGSVWWAGAG